MIKCKTCRRKKDVTSFYVRSYLGKPCTDKMCKRCRNEFERVLRVKNVKFNETIVVNLFPWELKEDRNTSIFQLENLMKSYVYQNVISEFSHVELRSFSINPREQYSKLEKIAN